MYVCAFIIYVYTCMYSIIIHCMCLSSYFVLDLLSQQLSQSEETVAKMKQLLVKTKKELGEGQRREEGLRAALNDLRTQLEEERQGSEQSKLELAQFTARAQTMKEQVGVA